MTKKSLFWLGFQRTIPYQGGLIPFGVLYATLATNAGFPWWLTLFFSTVVLGGSSQVVFIDLLNSLGSPFQAVLGSNIVNARHFIYSAALSQKFSGFSQRWKLILSYMMTDHLYALAESDSEDVRQLPNDMAPWYYFGSGCLTVATWLASAMLGIVFGRFIPATWNLDFSVPLMFLPLVFSVSKNRFAHLTAALAALLVIVFHSLPFGLGVFFAILGASLVGYFIKRRWS